MSAERDDRPAREERDLLAAYVDGVGELTAAERRRVERYLAEPGARDAQAATRALIDQLRELPPEADHPDREPDWSALERSIAEAVGDEVPRRSWWFRWRFALPAFALAAAGAIVLLVIDRRDPSDEISPIVFHPRTEETPPVFAAADQRVTVYLDGTDLELALEAADEADAELDDVFLDSAGAEGLEQEAALGFLESADLAWIDQLDDAALARAEQLLESALEPQGS